MCIKFLPDLENKMLAYIQYFTIVGQNILLHFFEKKIR